MRLPRSRSARRWTASRVKDGTTSDMVFTVPELVAYISSYTTLLPGDVILTGTPAGALCCRAAGRSIEIEGIGTLSNPVVGTRPEAPTTEAEQ